MKSRMFLCYYLFLLNCDVSSSFSAVLLMFCFLLIFSVFVVVVFFFVVSLKQYIICILLEEIGTVNEN